MGWLDAVPIYKSGDTPKYNVGDKVYKATCYSAGV